MGKLSTLACTLCIGLSTVVSFAGNKAKVIIPGKDLSKIPFTMPKGLVEGEDYLSKTIILKVKQDFRQNCKVNSIDNILVIQDLLSSIGAQNLGKIYPTHTQPAQQRNSMGQELVDLSLIYSFKYSVDINLEKVINQLKSLGYFEYVEPWYVYKTHDVQLNPNDPQWSSQYHLVGTGVVGTGSINCPNAWNITTGSTSVVIGIVDTGTAPTAPDLSPNLLPGWDVAMNDNNPTYASGQNHGVHVSGCASAKTNNGIGVASPGFNCRLLPVKAQTDGSTLITHGYEGITWAADNGANIINCSWGGSGGGSYGQNIIDYAAINKNCLMIVSAGNGGAEQSTYPSSYNNVYRVVWTTSSDAKSGSSDYGLDVDYCSPGSNILSTTTATQYGQMSGTSMASPVSAGAAGLVQSYYNYTNAFQIGEKLKQTCDPLSGTLWNAGKLGKGRIDVYNALTQSAKSLMASPITITDGNDDVFMPNENLSISALYTNYLDPTSSSAAATLTVLSGPGTVTGGSPYSIGTMATLATNNQSTPFTVNISSSAAVNAVIQFRLTITDGAFTGNQYFSVTVNEDYINITINDVHTSITSKGRIGYNMDGQQQGLGFEYQIPSPENLLYEMSLMIGTSSTKVSDMFRETTSGNTDFGSLTRAYQVSPAAFSDFDVAGKFNDVPAPSPVPVEVRHQAYAWSASPYRKFIIVKYVIKNTGASTLNNLYAGIVADWDITVAGQNKAAYDATNKMGYCYDVSSPGGLYAGIKCLTNLSSVKNYCIDNTTGGNGGVDPASDFLTAEKYTVLSTSRNNDGFSATGGDVMDCVSNGPFSVNAGDSIVVAFALIGGDNLADIQNSACYAQAKWDNTGPCSALSATATGTNATCFGQCNGTATANPVGGQSPYAYSWAPGGATTSSVSGLCAGSYSVTVTDAASATSVASVVINQPTLLSVSSSASNATICSGSCTSISANATGGSGGNSYTWMPGNLTGASVSVCPVAQTDYTVTVTDSQGCTGTSNTTVSVNPAQATPTITPSGSTTICQGNDVTLSSSTGNSYSWSTGATTQDIAVSASGNYSVTVSNASGCSASSAVTNVTVVPSPTVTITTSGVFCQGNNITLSSNAQTSYSWSTGATTQSIVVSAGGSYSVVVTNFCGNDSSSATVNLNSLPSVSVLINPDTTCVNAGAFTLTGGTPAGGTYSGNGVSGGNFDPAAAGGGLHNIIYSYTDGNNCTNSDTAQIYVDLCTGIQTFSDNSSISISPNPSNGIIKVKCSEFISSIEIVNILGETIFSSKMNALQIEIDLSKEPSGIYFIHFISNLPEPSIITRKFSISK